MKTNRKHQNRFFGPVEIEDGCPIPTVYQVCHEDTEDSILDEYGVRYSSDGTRLIGFEEKLPRRYVVNPSCRMICCNEELGFALSAADCFDDLEEIVLPEGLEVVADYAFHGLKKVKKLTIPSSVRFIGMGAFEAASTQKDFPTESDLPQEGSEEMPSDQKRTSDSLLEEVVILSGNIFIHNHAFFRQTALKRVSLAAITSEEDGVCIGRCAFGDCTSLRQIALPYGCKLSGNPFVGCHLDNIETPPLSDYTFCNGFLICYDEWTLNELIGYYGSEKEVILPDDINVIGPMAFCGNTTMQSVVLPKALFHIGSSAFSECTGLVSLVIPTLVSDIADLVFESCTSLKEVAIEGPVEILGHDLFYNCSSLERVTLPKSLKKIESAAFHLCKSLKKLTLPPYLEQIEGNPFLDSGVKTIESKSCYFKVEGDMLIDCCTDTLLAYFGNADELAIPEGILQIGEHAIANNTSLRHVALPESLRTIAERAFSRCIGLEEVTIPVNVNCIGTSAFYNCLSLTKVMLHEGLKHIERFAFNGCEELKEITIPRSVETIGTCAFMYHPEITFAGIPKSIEALPGVTVRVPKGTTEQFHQIMTFGCDKIFEY